MIICNGRAGKDKGVREFTIKNYSVVDYCIVSPKLLNFFNSFSILEPSKLFSDVQSPLSLTLKCYFQTNGGHYSLEIHEEKIKKRDNEKSA